ncbi:hypothetical protein Q541_01070 [Staphylococcus aureus M1485]|nr:hypothetical protein Q541_01070 [Staphylococcus aureus M1485]
MFKRTKLILIATILLSGCSTTNNESNNETKSVPEEMEAQNQCQKKWKLQNM